MTNIAPTEITFEDIIEATQGACFLPDGPFHAMTAREGFLDHNDNLHGLLNLPCHCEDCSCFRQTLPTRCGTQPLKAGRAH